MMRDRPWLLPLFVFVLALSVRVAYVHQSARDLGLDSDRLTQYDTFVFAQWARVIADGDLLCWRQPHAYHLWTADVAPESRWLEWYGGEKTYHQAPLYPYFVAAVYWAFGRATETLGYVQALLGALTCALTALLARRLVSPLAGWVAGLMLVFMGQFYFYDAFTLRDGPLALLTVVLALALDTASKRDRARDWLAAGAALGLFTLAKETGLPLLVLTLFVAALVLRRQPRRLLRVAGLLLIAWAVVCAPAFWRNYRVGAPTFKLSTRGPEVLVVGNARGQDGVGWDVPADMLRRILMEANFSLGRTAQLVLATHAAQPWGLVELQWHKTEAFFNGYEEPNNADFYLHAAHLDTLRLGLLPFGLVSALALLGLLLGLQRRRELAVPYLLLLALSASVIALYMLGRFRVHVFPLFALFAALAVDWIVRCLRTKRHVALVLAALPLVVFVSWTSLDDLASNRIKSYSSPAGKNTSMMMLLLKSGNYERALMFYDKLRGAIDAAGPAQATAYGEQLASIDEAFVHFRESTRWADDRPEHHLALGRGYAAMLGMAARYDKTEISNLAREQFDLVLRADPEAPGAHRGLASVHARNGRHGLAFGELNTELELHPEDGEALRDRGQLRLMFHDDVSALQDFREAFALGLTDDAHTLAKMARIEVNTLRAGDRPITVRGQKEAVFDPALGLRHARRALELAHDDPLVMECCADALYVNGFHDEAVELLRRAAAKQPEKSADLNNRADKFLESRANKEAARRQSGEVPPAESPPVAPPPAEGATPTEAGTPPAESAGDPP